MDKRYKNIYFWIGLLGVIFAAAGINAESVTSWDILFKDIINVIKNPFLFTSVIMAAIGVIVDPTTKGLRDCNIKLKELEKRNEK